MPLKSRKPPRLPPVPEYQARIVKRADMRARVVLEEWSDVLKLNAAPGVLLLLDSHPGRGFEIVAAEVYAAHEGGKILDVNLRADLSPQVDRIAIRRTSLGRAA